MYSARSIPAINETAGAAAACPAAIAVAEDRTCYLAEQADAAVFVFGIATRLHVSSFPTPQRRRRLFSFVMRRKHKRRELSYAFLLLFAGKKGLTQKEQLEVVRRFRDGGYNTLVATCVGEEGLDIGEVDLIVCYDVSKSPIRLVQRMGRTGRKREGRIIILVTEVYYDSSHSSFQQSVLIQKSNYRGVNAGLKELPDQGFVHVSYLLSAVLASIFRASPISAV